MMAKVARYTLAQNANRQALFEEIWQQYPRLRGQTARTMHLALELMADGDGIVSRAVSAAPPELVVVTAAEEPEIDDSLFAGVEI
jgi:hypothetical protein